MGKFGSLNCSRSSMWLWVLCVFFSSSIEASIDEVVEEEREIKVGKMVEEVLLMEVGEMPSKCC